MISNSYNINKIFSKNIKDSSKKIIYELFLKNISEYDDLLYFKNKDNIDLNLFKEIGFSLTCFNIFKTDNINFEKLDFNNKFIGIWISDCLISLSEEIILKILKKVFISLKNKGVIYISFKLPSKNLKNTNKNFTYFTKEKFLKLIFNFKNYRLLTFETSNKYNEKNLNILIQKVN